MIVVLSGVTMRSESDLVGAGTVIVLLQGLPAFEEPARVEVVTIQYGPVMRLETFRALENKKRAWS